jgi:hypothetical protein
LLALDNPDSHWQMYPYHDEGQPVDAALDENGQPAIQSSSGYDPQAANLGLDYYQQPQDTTSSYFMNVPGPASQSSGLGDQTSPSALFPYTPESLSDPNYPGGTSQLVFPDPQFDDPSTSFVDDPSTSFVDEPSTASVDNPFQYTLDPQVGYHPMYNPFPISHQGSGPPHQFLQHHPMVPPPIVSFDGASTLAPGSVDIGPRREPMHLDDSESLSLGDSVQIREPPPPRPSGSQNPQPPGKSFEFKHWPYPRA